LIVAGGIRLFLPQHLNYAPARSSGLPGIVPATASRCFASLHSHHWPDAATGLVGRSLVTINQLEYRDTAGGVPPGAGRNSLFRASSFFGRSTESNADDARYLGCSPCEAGGSNGTEEWAVIRFGVGVTPPNTERMFVLQAVWQLNLLKNQILRRTIRRMSILSKLLGGKIKPSPKANPALEYIQSMPQNYTTETLIAALPNISVALFTEAKQLAKTIGVHSELFAECILDLELVGGFKKAVEFTKSKALASAYMDSIIIEVTGKDPRKVPSELEFKTCGTENYRGIAKYTRAEAHFNVSSPHAWLFGKEYSHLKTGNAMDFAYVAGVGAYVPSILETGDVLFELIVDLSSLRLDGSRESLTLEKILRSLDADRAQQVCARWTKNN
jgi:hypothetical protein